MRSKSQILSKLRADGHITDEEYKLLEQEPCEDAINRQAVEEIINDIRDCISVEGYWAILERLKKLPSVNPQEPKTGHCKDCKHFRKLPYHAGAIGKCVNHWGFCPPSDWYCADFEPQESEVEE